MRTNIHNTQAELLQCKLRNAADALTTRAFATGRKMKAEHAARCAELEDAAGRALRAAMKRSTGERLTLFRTGSASLVIGERGLEVVTGRTSKQVQAAEAASLVACWQFFSDRFTVCEVGQ